MSIAEEYRRRASELERLAFQSLARERSGLSVLAKSWRELADGLEREDTDQRRPELLQSRPRA
jgi:hypothetical protein